MLLAREQGVEREGVRACCHGGFLLVASCAGGQVRRMADDDFSRFGRLITKVHRAWNGQDDAGADEEHLSALEAFIRFWGLTVKSFVRNRVPVRAAALAYSSLLALVPMLALVLSMAFGFLRGEEGQKQIEVFIHHIVEAVAPSGPPESIVSTTLAGGEIKDLASLVAKLNKPTNAATTYLSGRLSTETRQALGHASGAAVDSVALQTSLLTELNAIIEGPSFHEARRFTGVSLGAETRRLLAAEPDGTELAQLNRRLLEEIFPAEIPRRQGTHEIVETIQTFVQNQQASAVSASAALMLVFIAIMMLSRIEDTFNDIWGVQRGRSWSARVTQYWAALTLGPVLMILVIGLTTSTELQSVKATLASMPLGIGRAAEFLFKFLPFALLSLGFAGFYASLPATKVHWKAALVGGVVGGCLWQLNNLLSVLYVSRVVANNKVYGSLGMVPVVMIGLYFSWIILLFGAQVAYSFQNRRAYFQERQVESLDQHSREFIGLRIMVEIARRFLLGEKPVTGAALSELLGVPTGLAGKLLQALVSARLLAENQQSEAAYLPARPLEKITCHDVLHALRSNQNGSVSTRDDTMREQVRGHYEHFQEVQKAAANNVTLATLAADAAASTKPTE